MGTARLGTMTWDWAIWEGHKGLGGKDKETRPGLRVTIVTCCVRMKIRECEKWVSNRRFTVRVLFWFQPTTHPSMT